jgi:hypothetical protein
MKPIKGGQGPVWDVAPLIIVIISIRPIFYITLPSVPYRFQILSMFITNKILFALFFVSV